jgi:polysaccharide biosynthesis protein PslH
MKPKLLFLGSNLPWPADGGPELRSLLLLRALAIEYDVTALLFYRNSARPDRARVAASVERLSEWARTEAFPIPQDVHGWRTVADHLRSLATATVYTRYIYSSAEYRARLREVISAIEFDVVHVDSLDLAGVLPDLHGLTVVCGHHNLESDLLRQRARSEGHLLKRKYLGLQADLMRREELRWCGRVALNVMTSEADAQRLRELVPAARVAVVPNGIDAEGYTPDPGGSGIAFVGGADWFPNRDGMTFFCEQILPLIREVTPAAVTWVGRATAPDQDRFRTEYDVTLTGYVDDVQARVRDAACFIAPLRVGGGTRLKILEAWAMGKAVVSTSIGCEGLAARDADNILMRDDARGFADAVVSVLSDADLRARLGAAGRQTVEQDYDRPVIAAQLLRAYSALSNSPAQHVVSG